MHLKADIDQGEDGGQAREHRRRRGPHPPARPRHTQEQGRRMTSRTKRKAVCWHQSRRAPIPTHAGHERPRHLAARPRPRRREHARTHAHHRAMRRGPGPGRRAGWRHPAPAGRRRRSEPRPMPTHTLLQMRAPPSTPKTSPPSPSMPRDLDEGQVLTSGCRNLARRGPRDPSPGTHTQAQGSMRCSRPTTPRPSPATHIPGRHRDMDMATRGQAGPERGGTG